MAQQWPQIVLVQIVARIDLHSSRDCTLTDARAGVQRGTWRAGRLRARLSACNRGWNEGQCGHDLDQNNLRPLLRHAPAISEVSIGHALIGEALESGLTETVRRYVGIIARRPLR